MKKSLLLGLSTLALIGTATVSHARMNDNSWYVGAGASWIGTNETNKFSMNTGPDADEQSGIHKIGLEDKAAFGGTLLVGKNLTDNMFSELGYSFDTSSANARKTVDNIAGDSTDVNLTLNRMHTYSLGLGYSTSMNESLDAYFKISALFTQFQVDNKVSDIAEGGEYGSASKKQWRWGWAPTIGLAKDLGRGFNLKGDYSYQMYSRIRQGLNPQGNAGADANTLNKIKPRYHVVSVTLTKSF
tara:strand:+ start:760 stop:1488 length:729 start_codon:yes stop_codon:yes gene_type:complete